MNQDQEFKKAYWEAKDALCQVIEQLQDRYQFSATEAAQLLSAELKAIPFTNQEKWETISSVLNQVRLRKEQIANSNRLAKQLEYDDKADIAF